MPGEGCFSPTRPMVVSFAAASGEPVSPRISPSPSVPASPEFAPPPSEPQDFWVQWLDKAIVGVSVIAVLLVLSRFLRPDISIQGLSEKWGFRRPGAVAFAQELIARSRTESFPFVYETAYRALETSGELSSEASDGALLFLFLYAGNRSHPLEDRKVAGVLLLSRLPQHSELKTCGFEVLASVKRHWPADTIQALLPAFQTFFLFFHRTLAEKTPAAIQNRLEMLTGSSGEWNIIRAPETPSPLSAPPGALTAIEAPEASATATHEEIFQ